MSLDLYWTVDHAERLHDWLERSNTLASLSNHALAALVEDHLWAVVPVLTPASDLLAEVIDRLRDAVEEP